MEKIDKIAFAKRVANDQQARQKFIESLSLADRNDGIQHLQNQLATNGAQMTPDQKSSCESLIQLLQKRS
jgi:hypothetical protein